MGKIYSFDAKSADGQTFILSVYAEQIDPAKQTDSNTIARTILTDEGNICNQVDLNTYEIPDLGIVVNRTSDYRK